MKTTRYIILTLIWLVACQPKAPRSYAEKTQKLSLDQANKLAQLPLKCMSQEYPNKPNQSLSSEADIDHPQALHPAFYGCFDWHSSVHGHWMLVKLLKKFPELDDRDEIRRQLAHHITKDKIAVELAYFQRPAERSFERTYGWAWLLKLAEELHTWDDPLARELEANLEPLSAYIVSKFMDFLPRLQYPIRVGEHSNTAFALALSYDYAVALNDVALQELITNRAMDFYMKDIGCPLSWEPSGFDFISPCLQEADLMRRILDPEVYIKWLKQFLPQLYQEDFKLDPGRVGDRSDGKLVHLDGLNFSRAWCLYGIASADKTLHQLNTIADEHLAYSLPHIVDGDYMGEHWLASFAIYALLQ